MILREPIKLIQHLVFKVPLLFALLAVFGAAQGTPETAIRRVLADQVAAWNRGDIPAFMQGYENSPETTFIGKSVQHGWQQVLDSYRKRYATPEAMGKLAFSELTVKILGVDYASVTGRFHLSRSAAGGGDASGIFSLIFRNTREGWRVILDHTS